jgi:hypothetical protein
MGRIGDSQSTGEGASTGTSARAGKPEWPFTDCWRRGVDRSELKISQRICSSRVPYTLVSFPSEG